MTYALKLILVCVMMIYENLQVKRYVVTLQKSERNELQQITYKGSHSSQKVINSLILLNCDEGPFNDRRESVGCHCRDFAD